MIQNQNQSENNTLAITTGSPEVIRMAELWRAEPWARIQSNSPYAIESDDSEGEALRKKAKEDFINDDSIVEPRLTYPKLDKIDIGVAIVRFDDMIRKLKLHPDEQPLLFESISRKIAELTRHRYVVEAEEEVIPEVKARYRDHAEAMAVEVFGDPEPGIFNGLLSDLREKAKASKNVYGRELLDLLPEIDEEVEIIRPEKLTPETIATLQPLLEELFAPALEIIDELPDGEFEHEEAIKIIQRLLDEMGIEGSKAVLTRGNALEADGFDMELQLGRNRAKLTRETFRTNVLHELSHLLGSYQGYQQENDVLSVGLPNNLFFEEGKCVAVEQISKGKTGPRGHQYYTGLGLLRGTIDGKKRTFRDVYEVLWRRQLVSEESVDDAAVAKAKAAAYQSTMRITRGHPADTRDLAYLAGDVKAAKWFNYIATLPTEQAYDLFKATITTKGDPTNPEHLEYLRAHHPAWQSALPTPDETYERTT